MKTTYVISTFIFVVSFLFSASAHAEATRLQETPPQPIRQTSPVPSACSLPLPNSAIEEISFSNLESIDIYSSACGRTEAHISGKGKINGQKNNTAMQIILVDNYNNPMFSRCLEQLNRGLIDRANVVVRGYIASAPIIARFDPFAVAIQSQIQNSYLYLTSCGMKR